MKAILDRIALLFNPETRTTIPTAPSLRLRPLRGDVFGSPFLVPKLLRSVGLNSSVVEWNPGANCSSLVDFKSGLRVGSLYDALSYVLAVSMAAR